MPTALQLVQKFFPEVETISDAKKNIEIEVTNADDKAAAKRSHKTCAMAVACKRKFKLDGVVISVNRAYLVKGTKAERFELPPSVSREVVSFDRGGGFEPGEYQLTKPGPSNKLGTHKYKKTGSGHGGGDGQRKVTHHTGGIRTALGSKMTAQ